MNLRAATYLFLACLPGLAEAQILFPQSSTDPRGRPYHVIHYRIAVAFDEVNNRVDGTTSITLASLSSRLDSLTLDAADMNIQSVSVPSQPARFLNRSPHLVVIFSRPLHFDTVTVSVRYSCTPRSGLYFIHPDSTNPSRRRQIWSQGEDADNHFWFPCYDYPDDKATSELIGTVPENYVLLSNGKLLNTTRDEAKKTRTFHWYESKPHSSYLIMVAAGEYEVVTRRYRDIPLIYYMYKDRVQDGLKSLAKTPAAMKFFEETIGVPYPWEKFAQIWISDFMWGGMENVSAVTLNDDTYLLDARAQVDFTSDDVVAHELAHQWWGDLITSRDWSNLWLHEGFANYFEALFKLYEKGEDYFQYDLMQQAASVISTEGTQGRSPLVTENGYTANVYSKGCWVLHMLKNILGEQEFLRALRLYARRFAFKNVDSHEFMRALEDATGRDLSDFFQQWVYRPGHPKVVVTSTWISGTRTLQLDFTQTQVMDSLTGVFSFPLSIECTTPTGRQLTNILIERKEQRVNILLPQKPLMVVLDRGKNVLASFEFRKTREEYIFQLDHALDITDRIAAAKQLKESNNDTIVFEALRKAATGDRFWAVRNQALLSLSSSDNPRVKEALLGCTHDQHSSVRSSAFAQLSRFSTRDVGNAVWRAALTDSSYLVLSSCMETLAEIDSVRGFDLAARCVEMKSYRNITRKTALEAFLTLNDARALPFALTYAGIANPPDIRRLSVHVLAALGKNSPTARTRLLELINDDVSVVRKAAIEGIAESGNPDARAVIVKRQLLEKDEAVKNAIDRAIESLAPGPDSPGEK